MVIQFKKGLLEYCILSLLRGSDRYGYDIAQTLGERIEIADGTVYPILRRLCAENCLTSYIREGGGGPPRKYYAMTPAGRDLLASLSAEWNTLVKQVAYLTETEEGETQHD